MLQPTEMYLVLSSLMILPMMILLSVLALTGAFDRIESVKYVVLDPPEGDDEDSPEDGSSTSRGR